MLVIQEREPLLFELLAKVIPRDGLERFLATVAGKIYSEDPGVFLVRRASDTQRVPAALLDPAARLALG